MPYWPPTLKAALATGEPKEGEPSVAEPVEKIKTLRTANTVEATPQRTAKRQVSAEEPVTTRIRRREEPGTVVDDADVASASRGRVSEEAGDRKLGRRAGG